MMVTANQANSLIGLSSGKFNSGCQANLAGTIICMFLNFILVSGRVALHSVGPGPYSPLASSSHVEGTQSQLLVPSLIEPPTRLPALQILWQSGEIDEVAQMVTGKPGPAPVTYASAPPPAQVV